MLLFIHTFSYKISRTKKNKSGCIMTKETSECFTLYNFINATRAGRNCINLFISASLSNLSPFPPHAAVSFSYIQHPACKSLLCGYKPGASPRAEFEAVCPSVHHPSIFSSPFPTPEVTRSGGGTHPSQVTSQMGHEKSEKFLWVKVRVPHGRQNRNPNADWRGRRDFKRDLFDHWVQRKNSARGMW